MLPTISWARPQRANMSAVHAVVVDLPFVPVIAEDRPAGEP